MVELVVILNYLGGHRFMTATKNNQICDLPLPNLSIRKNKQYTSIDLLFKNKGICSHMTNYKTLAPHSNSIWTT